MVTPTAMELRRHGDPVGSPVDRARRTTTRQTPGTNPNTYGLPKVGLRLTYLPGPQECRDPRAVTRSRPEEDPWTLTYMH
jgi:hypothetical protein